MLWISTKNPIPGVFVDRRVLEETLRFICKAAARYNLDIDLDALTGMSHLFIGL